MGWRNAITPPVDVAFSPFRISVRVAQNLKQVSCSQSAESHFSIPLKALAIKFPASRFQPHKREWSDTRRCSFPKLTSAKKANERMSERARVHISENQLSSKSPFLSLARSRLCARDVRLDQIFIPSNMCAITSHEHTHLLPIDAVQGGIASEPTHIMYSCLRFQNTAVIQTARTLFPLMLCNILSHKRVVAPCHT